ncbi:MAG: SDR family oxidoreductase [Rubripirellula sp.]
MPKSNLSPPNSHPRKNVLIYGCGYLGRELGQQLLFQGWDVCGSTRSRENATNLSNIGIHPIISDWNDTRTLGNLESFSNIVIAVSRSVFSKRDHWETLVLGLQNLLPRISPFARITYISSTGVFHQRQGEWVDETTPTRPNRPSTQSHLAAENLLRKNRLPNSWSILRLAGIYGPSRIPNSRNLTERKPILADPDSYLNLIHVEDAAQAVIATLERSDQRVYVVSDDRPVLRANYYGFIAKHLGCPEPIFAIRGVMDTVNARSSGNKRVWNRRMKKELLPKLRYPTFIEGLTPLLDSVR